MIAKSVERIGLIVAGAGAGALILAGTGLAKWALIFGAIVALGAWSYQRFDKSA